MEDSDVEAASAVIRDQAEGGQQEVEQESQESFESFEADGEAGDDQLEHEDDGAEEDPVLEAEEQRRDPEPDMEQVENQSRLTWIPFFQFSLRPAICVGPGSLVKKRKFSQSPRRQLRVKWSNFCKTYECSRDFLLPGFLTPSHFSMRAGLQATPQQQR